jgi:hypothetical protein
MKSTFGEILFAVVPSSLAAGLAGVAGLIGGIFLHGWLYGKGLPVAGFYVAIGLILLMPVGVSATASPTRSPLQNERCLTNPLPFR